MYVAHRTRRISGGRILEKPRPERHWPPTKPRVPLLDQSRRELITAAVLLSAFHLLKTLRFRALCQREYVYICTHTHMRARTPPTHTHIICMPISVYIVSVPPSLSSTELDHLLFLGRENFPTSPLVPSRWILRSFIRSFLDIRF